MFIQREDTWRNLHTSSNETMVGCAIWGEGKRRSRTCIASLLAHSDRVRTGVAIGDNVGFLVDLPNRRSFCPDAAFWTAGPLTEKFFDGAPVFAVEVRSPEDHGTSAERRLAAKRADYFAAGTLVVWDVDLRGGCVNVYRAARPDSPDVSSRGEHADAEPAVPGWSMPVADLFPEQR
jgi:Uma2 family endonuclease